MAASFSNGARGRIRERSAVVSHEDQARSQAGVKQIIVIQSAPILVMGDKVSQGDSRVQPAAGGHQLVRGVFVAQQPRLHVVWATRQRSVSSGNARA